MIYPITYVEMYTEKKVQFGCRNNANIDVCTPSKKACKCVSDWRANLKKIGVCKPHFSLSARENDVLFFCFVFSSMS